MPTTRHTQSINQSLVLTDHATLQEHLRCSDLVRIGINEVAMSRREQPCLESYVQSFSPMIARRDTNYIFFNILLVL